MEKKLNILACDDHTLFRKGIVMLLNSFPETESVKEAENGQQALDIMAESPIDVLLLDLEMPVLDGWETAKKVLELHPDTFIIMISMHDSLPVISDFIEMGIHSYLVKDADPEEVHKALISVINNEFYYNKVVAKALHQKVQDAKNNYSAQHDLTNREIEVLSLISQELTMKEIGEKLFLSEQTIHTHRKNLMKKTRAKNAVGLVKFAIQQRIVTL